VVRIGGNETGTGTGVAHRGTERVARALATLAPESVIIELDASARTAAHAASALGCPPGAIANSLIFMADTTPLLIMTSGDHRVDLDLVAASIGVDALRRATPEEVRAATGQPIGGVAPVGHPSPVRTLVDESLSRYENVWAAAGTPHSVFATTYRRLLAMTGGQSVVVSNL
jgi:prolyl-tRNA editing enzyme YbaK/EbsC (Cys-tRNA(Pro) deacylase)